jgi:hypothetical protein
MEQKKELVYCLKCRHMKKVYVPRFGYLGNGECAHPNSILEYDTCF